MGLLVARTAYVVRHADAYAPEPWSILAVWQGGFLPWAGIAAAGAAVAAALEVSDAADEELVAELDAADDDEDDDPDPLSSLPQPTAAAPTSSAAPTRPTVLVEAIFIGRPFVEAPKFALPKFLPWSRLKVRPIDKYDVQITPLRNLDRRLPTMVTHRAAIARRELRPG